MRRTASAWLLTGLLVSAACSGGAPSGASSAPSSDRPPEASPTQPAVTTAPAPTFAASLQFSEDASRAAQTNVTVEAGGTVNATAADGPTSSLTVPPLAVLADTLVTVTPITDVHGLGD